MWCVGHHPADFGGGHRGSLRPAAPQGIAGRGVRTMEFAACTHVGKIRKANEDNYYIPTPDGENYCQCFFAVADGMGGHNAGEIASALAIRGMLNFLGKPGKLQDEL